MDYKSLSTTIFVGFVLLLTIYIIFNNKTTPSRPEPQPIIEGFKNYVEPFANAESFDAATLKLHITEVFMQVYARDITNDEATYYLKYFDGASAGSGKTPQEKQNAIDKLKMYMTQVMTADKAAGRDVSKVTTPDTIGINDSTGQTNAIGSLAAPKYPLNATEASKEFLNWNDETRPVTNPESQTSKMATDLAKTAISTTNLPPFRTQALDFAPVDAPQTAQTSQLVKKPIIVDADIPKVIDDLYMETFGTLPTSEEKDFYIKFFKGTESTRQQMKEVIVTSAPSLVKIMKTGVPVNLDKTLTDGTEEQVISIFNQILERNPSEKELQYFSAFIKESPAQIERMKIILLQSQEYKRLSNMQTNLANGQLLGGLTEKQITVIVKSIYKELNPEPLDDDTLRFLKKKYLEFKLDEPRFRRFIKRFVMFNTPAEEAAYDARNAANTAISVTAPSPAPVPAPIVPNAAIVSSLTSTAFTPAPNTTNFTPVAAPAPIPISVMSATPTTLPVFSNDSMILSSPATTVETPTPTPISIAPASSSIQIVERFAEEPTPSYKTSDFLPSSVLSGNDTGVNTAKLIDAIKARANATFDKDTFYNKEFDKNALENAFNGELSTKEKELSTLIYDRNRDELKNTCMRNKDFAQYHYDHMSVLPTSQYSVIPNDKVQKSQETLWSIRH